MSFLEALLQNPLLQMALFASLGASFASGIIGPFIVVKRIVSLSGSIAHTVLGGLGCALFLRRVYGIEWLQPIHGALMASILAALVIGYVHLHHREREDSVIAMIWSLGMSTGIIFASQTPGYNVELMNFLLGNVLWVNWGDLMLLGGIDLLILVVISLKYKHFLALCFDEDEARLQGLSVSRLYFSLLALIALAIVILIHTVGIILVLTMLVLPASIAEKFTFRLSRMIIVSIFLNILFSVGGLALAYKLDWPAGATIALFAGFIYILSLRFKRATSLSTPSPVKAEISTASS